MTKILEIFCVKENSDFRLGPALVMLFLILAFIGSSVYILFNSLT